MGCYRLRMSYRGAGALHVLIIVLSVLALPLFAAPAAAGSFTCVKPYILDGDTFDCSGTRVRLKGIDTPEMRGHCPPGKKCVKGNAVAAKKYLISLTRTTLTCHRYDVDKYNRIVAECFVGDVNLSCAMLESGHAERRYAPVKCP